jgi:hypothetical protein
MHYFDLEIVTAAGTGSSLGDVRDVRFCLVTSTCVILGGFAVKSSNLYQNLLQSAVSSETADDDFAFKKDQA